MKTLYLLRHAKSDWGNEGLRDFDRPLNHRGRKAAKAVGRAMRDRDIRPDLVIASPAIRAKETVERILEGYGHDLRVTEDPRIYEGGTGTLLGLITGAPDDVEQLMLIGHNPGFQQLVLALSDASALRGEVEEGFPTAALAELRFPIDRWSEVAPGTGQLQGLIKPRDL